MTGTKLVNVTYRGAQPGVMSVVQGETDLMFCNLLPAMPLIKSNRLRALAVTSAKRYGAVPDIPTVAESGLPGFVAVNWYGWLAPAGTPAAIVNKLNAEIGNVVRMPDVQQRFAHDGAEPVTSTPPQFSERVVSEVARWRKVVKEANLRFE